MQPLPEGSSHTAPVDRTRLAEFMKEAYNEIEFDTLCISLKVDKTTFKKIQDPLQKRYALIDHFERHEGNYQRLVDKVRKDRPERQHELIETPSQTGKDVVPLSPTQLQSGEESRTSPPPSQNPRTESAPFGQTQALSHKPAVEDVQPSKEVIKTVHDNLLPTIARIKLDEKTLSDFSEKLYKIFINVQLSKNETNINVSTDQFHEYINDAIDALHVAYVLREKINDADTSDLKALWTDFLKCLDESRKCLKKAMEVMDQFFPGTPEHP